VLVALGVWLIPWVLDGPARDVPDPVADNTLTLPTDDSVLPVHSETVELETNVTAASAPVHAEASAPETVVQADPPAVPVPPPSRSASAPVAATPAPSPAASAAEPDGWSVQLGAFTDQANARQLASRVDDLGFDTIVTEFRSSGRTMYRVRVGGYSSRNEAEAAASSLNAHNFPARVVQPE